MTTNEKMIRSVIVSEMLGREQRCYVQGRPTLRGTATETLAWWRECEAAALSNRRCAAGTRVVWALSMVDVERLAMAAPAGTPGESQSCDADGKMLPITWLRYLSDNGQLFEWSATAIRRAREDYR